ncbi:helix-turn-helix transcriptional regulator [Labrenzia sp. PHM005]|nr:helix-turn-helix transcriptional regulator [Labrenzia sp. PHM005]
MISIPVSFLLATVFLLLWVSVLFSRSIPRRARFCFLVLLTVLMIEAVLVGMRFAFGFDQFVIVQRTLAIWISPLTYLSFLALSEPAERLRRLMVLHGAIALTASGVLLLPVPIFTLIDGVVAVSFGVYTVLLVQHWRRGADALSQIPTGATGRWSRIEAGAAGAMFATLVIDCGIALLFFWAEVEAAARLLSLATLAGLAGAAGLVLWIGRADRKASDERQQGTSSEELATVVAAAKAILADQELFRDDTLTASRLARRVGVPDRELSRAINLEAGMSVSQFVNQFRLEEAARLLRETDDPVTHVLEAAGFLTRSNFYKEFQKRYELSPGAYRKKHQAAA